MPLHRDWVEKIHTRLLARYGSAWISLYRDIDPALVVADWAEALNGFGAEAIRHALSCLPDDAPPNAAQFARLCMRGPQSQAPVLPWPTPDPAMVARVMSGIKRPAQRNPRQWVHDLKAREERGDNLTQAQRDMWRTALSAHVLLDQAKHGENIPCEAITDALRATGDIPKPAEWLTA
jgi:hypothetical protein